MQELQHSQNFIRDGKTIKSLLKKTDMTKKDTVLDIGAGDGLIAGELSKIVKSVIAIELDLQSAQNLQIKFGQTENVRVIAEDFFQFELPKSPYKVFSNPPFSRTADIVRKFLESSNPPSSMCLFMQKEAAERFIGKPKMTQISAIYYPDFEIQIASKVHRTVFVPIPNVDVVLSSFTKRKTPLVKEQFRDSYRDFVSYTFNQWQPTVMDSLKRIFTNEQRKRIKKDLGIDKQKPSELTHADLLKLFEVFAKYVPIQTKQIITGAFRKQQENDSLLSKDHRTRVSSYKE